MPLFGKKKDKGLLTAWNRLEEMGKKEKRIRRKKRRKMKEAIMNKKKWVRKKK